MLCSEQRTSRRRDPAERPGHRLRGNSERGCPKEGVQCLQPASAGLSDSPDGTLLLCPRGQFLLRVPKDWPFQIQSLDGNVVACPSAVCTRSGCR